MLFFEYICLIFSLSYFDMIGSISFEKSQSNGQGDIWRVRRVGKQSCPAYGCLQCRSTQRGTGAALLTSQKSKNQCHSFSPTEQTFGPSGWDLTIVIRLFMDVVSFLGVTSTCVETRSRQQVNVL